MSSAFLIVVTILLAFVAGIWSAKGWQNIAIKAIYIVVAIWAAGLAVNHLGWVA